VHPVPAADFFISYTQADEKWAKWIDSTLVAAGHSVLMQAWDMNPGDNVIVSMHRFATACRRTILVMSTNSLTGKPFVEIEWAAALVADPDGRRRKLVPVRVDDCRPTGLLASIVHIDLYWFDPTTARDRLLTGLFPATRPAGIAPFPGAAAT
jgi:hypothetical protein